MHPSQTRETAFNKDEGKHGQREILESRDIRQVPTKRRVEVQNKRRVYMSCMRQNFSSIFDHSEETSMSFVLHTHDLTNILRKRLILQQSVERH